MSILIELAKIFDCLISDFHYSLYLRKVKNVLYQMEDYPLDQWKQAYAYIFNEKEEILLDDINAIKQKIYERIGEEEHENILICKDK